jgi:hypothetical protein
MPKKATAMKETTELGFQAQIYNDVDEMPNRLTFVDTSNKGKSFSMLLMWKKVEQLASKKYDKLLESMVGDGMMDDPKSLTVPGNHVLAETSKVSVMVNVSVPRREFNVDWLAKKLLKEYKVPEAMTKVLIEEAKRPGATQVRRITVSEKGG